MRVFPPRASLLDLLIGRPRASPVEVEPEHHLPHAERHLVRLVRREPRDDPAHRLRVVGVAVDVAMTARRVAPTAHSDQRLHVVDVRLLRPAHASQHPMVNLGARRVLAAHLTHPVRSGVDLLPRPRRDTVPPAHACPIPSVVNCARIAAFTDRPISNRSRSTLIRSFVARSICSANSASNFNGSHASTAACSRSFTDPLPVVNASAYAFRCSE